MAAIIGPAGGFRKRNAFSATFLMPVLVPTGAPPVSPLVKDARIIVVGRPLAKRRSVKVPTWQLSGGLIETTVQGRFKFVSLEVDKRHRRPGGLQFFAQRKGMSSAQGGIQWRGKIVIAPPKVDRLHHRFGNAVYALPKKSLFTPAPGITRLGKISSYQQPAKQSARVHKEWLRFARFIKPLEQLAPPAALSHKPQIFIAPGSQFRSVDQLNASVGRSRLLRQRYSGSIRWLVGLTSEPVTISLPGAVCTIILPQAIGNRATISVTGDVCTIDIGVVI